MLPRLSLFVSHTSDKAARTREKYPFILPDGERCVLLLTERRLWDFTGAASRLKGRLLLLLTSQIMVKTSSPQVTETLGMLYGQACDRGLPVATHVEVRTIAAECPLTPDGAVVLLHSPDSSRRLVCSSLCRPSCRLIQCIARSCEWQSGPFSGTWVDVLIPNRRLGMLLPRPRRAVNQVVRLKV